VTSTRRGRGALRSTLAVAGVVGVAVGLVALVAVLQRGGDHHTSSTASTSTTLGARAVQERDASQAWSKEAQAAFGGQAFAQRVTDLATGAHDWLAGTLPADQFASRLQTDLTVFSAGRDAVAALRPYPYDPRVNDLFNRTAKLYVDSVRIYQEALAGPAGDARTQLDRLARRVRLLGDRVFDRGQALIEPHLHDQASTAVDIRRPEEVPNWVAEGLAAGPPLDVAPPPPPSEPQLRQASRPQQPRDAWLKAVQAAAAPSADDVRAAAAAGDTARLAGLATRLVAAAEKLRSQPDPRGDREESTRYRLGLLVDADAARAAQLGALVTAPPLSGIAADILAAGDGLR
jgi:hypothetical protein